jgi:hypothetical protein
MHGGFVTALADMGLSKQTGEFLTRIIRLAGRGFESAPSFIVSRAERGIYAALT